LVITASCKPPTAS